MRKKYKNYDKIEIAAQLRNLNMIFPPFDRYYHAIYIAFTYFASFTGNEDDSFEVIYNVHVQRCKFGRK